MSIVKTYDIYHVAQNPPKKSIGWKIDTLQAGCQYLLPSSLLLNQTAKPNDFTDTAFEPLQSINSALLFSLSVKIHFDFS
ncbi:hypothetical protein LJB76_01600 [Clostridia bacterium OttesenSCG-928-O13]|nr:hypothetical protein [Clostridia bacterium OttesenSCG-928-O13]